MFDTKSDESASRWWPFKLIELKIVVSGAKPLGVAVASISLVSAIVGLIIALRGLLPLSDTFVIVRNNDGQAFAVYTGDRLVTASDKLLFAACGLKEHSLRIGTLSSQPEYIEGFSNCMGFRATKGIPGGTVLMPFSAADYTFMVSAITNHSMHAGTMRLLDSSSFFQALWSWYYIAQAAILIAIFIGLWYLGQALDFNFEDEIIPIALLTTVIGIWLFPHFHNGPEASLLFICLGSIFSGALLALGLLCVASPVIVLINSQLNDTLTSRIVSYVVGLPLGVGIFLAFFLTMRVSLVYILKSLIGLVFPPGVYKLLSIGFM